MVKFMRKTVVFFILTIVLIFPCLFARGTSMHYEKKPYLMDNPEYKRINPSMIKSLIIVRYTEGGVSEKTINDRIAINKLYDYLKRVELLDESGMSCTDNTLQRCSMQTKQAAVEIECEWIVLNGKNYKFKVEPIKK